MALEVAELEEGELAPFHGAVVLLGDEAVELLLVTLQELGSPELTLAVVYIALVGPGHLVAHQVAPQGALRLERLLTLVALEGAHLGVDLHVAPHVVLCGEHLVAQQAFDVLGALHVHVLHVLVQVRPVVGRVVALRAVEQLGLVREVRVVVDLKRKTSQMNPYFFLFFFIERLIVIAQSTTQGHLRAFMNHKGPVSWIISHHTEV